MIRPRLEETLEALVDAGFDEAEVYAKQGRSRCLERTPKGRVVVLRQEKGWAARAGTSRASLFFADSGEPSPEVAWPEPDGGALRLPDPVLVPAFQEPADLDAPLLAEREGWAMLDAIAEELEGELPGARLLHAVVEDGSSESEVLNRRGVRGRWRQRLASLRLEVAGPEGAGGRPTAVLDQVEREARRLHPRALARRLADRLAVRSAGPQTDRDRGEVLLAPEVGRAVLLGLLPLLVGPSAAALADRLRDRSGRIAGGRVTVVDDGRLAGGLLAAPVDGEGMPTREVLLVDEGFFRQPVLAWWQAKSGAGRPSGCCRRAGWRDVPAPGATHLYVRSKSGVAVASLLAGVARGYYFIDVGGRARFDLENDRFHLPVAGFAVRQGRAAAAVSGVALSGSVSAFLHGVHGVARDLAFAPGAGGLLGCPSLLVHGLEVVAEPHPGPQRDEQPGTEDLGAAAS